MNEEIPRPLVYTTIGILLLIPILSLLGIILSIIDSILQTLNEMVQAILFDFWGTLVENGIFPSPVRQVRYILRLRMPFQEFIVKFEEAFMLKKYETLKEAFENVCKAFDVNPPPFVIEKLIGMWNKNMLLAKPFPETIKVLEALKKNHKLAIISNTDSFSLEPVLNQASPRLIEAQRIPQLFVVQESLMFLRG